MVEETTTRVAEPRYDTVIKFDVPVYPDTDLSYLHSRVKETLWQVLGRNISGYSSDVDKLRGAPLIEKQGQTYVQATARVTHSGNIDFLRVIQEIERITWDL